VQPSIRRYGIPESRLPFVNAEIAELEFLGRPDAWLGLGGDGARGDATRVFVSPPAGVLGRRRGGRRPRRPRRGLDLTGSSAVGCWGRGRGGE